MVLRRIGNAMSLLSFEIKIGFRDLRTIHRRRAQLQGRLGRTYENIMDFIQRHQPVRFFPHTRFRFEKRQSRKGRKETDAERFSSRTAIFTPRYAETENTNIVLSETLLTEMRRAVKRTGSHISVASTGCGVGVQELFAATRFPQVKIDAIDPYQGPLEEARRIKRECGDKQVDFKQGSFEHPNLPLGSYDLAVAFNAIHWVGKNGLKQALQNQKNLLKKSPHSCFVVSWIPHHDRQNPKMTTQQLKEYQITKEHMIKTAQEVGLSLEKEYYPPMDYNYQGILGVMPRLVFKLRLN